MSGVQLEDGRLVAPCAVNQSRAACFSDDHGDTWHAGQPVPLSSGAIPLEHAETSEGMPLHMPMSADSPLWAEKLGALGETSVTRDGRGPRSLTFFIRAGSSRLASHAYALSDDGGETWSAAVPLPSIIGPTCEGGVVGSPGGPGQILMSAPYSHDAGLTGREDLRLWLLDVGRGEAPAPKMLGRLWGCKGAYSAFSQEPGGDKEVLSLFEAGETYRYESVVLARFRAPAGVVG